jgi:hypothetical protein
VKRLLLLVFLAVASPANAELVALPSVGRVEIACEPDLEATARELSASAEQALAEIADDLVDLPVPQHIRVQLVRDASSLSHVHPGGAPPWAIGVASPTSGVISVALRRGAQQVDPLSTLRHELGHVALGAALGERAPHWLHEGFASQHSREWSWDRAETLAQMAWLGGVVPIEDLDRSFPAQELPANRAYAEAYDFVGFLSRRGRYEDPEDDGDRWPFRKFLTELGHGVSLDAAATHAYGKSIRGLFDEWSSDLSKRYLVAPVGLLGLALWVTCALLLVLAWRRRRRLNRARLDRWEREERAHDEAVIAPAYVPWPGEDPFAEPQDPEDPPPTRLTN